MSEEIEMKKEVCILFHVKDREYIRNMETFIPVGLYCDEDYRKAKKDEFGKFGVDRIRFRAMCFNNLNIKSFKNIFDEPNKDPIFDGECEGKLNKIIVISNWEIYAVREVMAILTEYIYDHCPIYPPDFNISTGMHKGRKAIFLTITPEMRDREGTK